jgi:DNA excision repair protein ERCC-6-like 2
VSACTIEEIVYARQIYKQQQANIGYNASMERRYFKGVQNQKGQKGEIFGLQNLLTFHGDDVVLRDIVNKTNVAEAKAGVNILDVGMSNTDEDNPLAVDDDSEDAAMSQLAALIAEGEDVLAAKQKKVKPKTDAIQAILASAGVEYTHENSEVVGSSKIEAHLSRRAEETGNDIAAGDEVLFAESQRNEVFNPNVIQYEYRPPEDVILRQFCTMANMFGFDSVTDFALIVEGWTQEQRRNCLDKFYRMRKERLAELEVERAKAEGINSFTPDGEREGSGYDDDDDEL